MRQSTCTCNINSTNNNVIIRTTFTLTTLIKCTCQQLCSSRRCTSICKAREQEGVQLHHLLHRTLRVVVK